MHLTAAKLALAGLVRSQCPGSAGTGSRRPGAYQLPLLATAPQGRRRDRQHHTLRKVEWNRLNLLAVGPHRAAAHSLG